MNDEDEVIAVGTVIYETRCASTGQSVHWTPSLKQAETAFNDMNVPAEIWEISGGIKRCIREHSGIPISKELGISIPIKGI